MRYKKEIRDRSIKEAYRWSSLGYHVQAKNAENFLSLDFGLKEFDPSEIRSTDPSGIFHGVKYKNNKERLGHYHLFVYEKGGLTIRGEEKVKGVEISNAERFRYRTRYFTDSGIIGTKDFVERIYIQFKDHFSSKHEKKPKTIKGLDGIFSLKRLSEAI